jgi:hypothetical protein
MAFKRKEMAAIGTKAPFGSLSRRWHLDRKGTNGDRYIHETQFSLQRGAVVINRHRLWTEIEDRKLLESLTQGKSESSIARLLRRTTHAVSPRLYVLPTKTKARAPGEEQ